jgi:thiopeptide-type bacteriocin biosynthesis protein
VSTPLEHAGSFVVRAPMLPYATVDLDSGSAAIEAYRAGEPVDDAVAADRATLQANLKTLLDDPTFREALFLASPDLDERVEAGDDVLRGVLSYAWRMATRCTPFGLFAGCGAGPVGGPIAPLRLAPRDAVRRHTRLDFGFLAAVVQTLATDPQTRDVLTYVPNTSLYRAGRRLRMAEARIDEQRRVRYHRVTFEEDEFLTETLARAEGGAKLDDLAAALAVDDVSIEEAREYIGDLVQAQLLVPNLGPPVTGDEPVPGMVAKLRTHPTTSTVAEVLQDAEAELDALDAAGPGQERQRYRELAERLRKVDPDLRLDRLFQLDVSLGTPGPSLPDAVVTEVRRAVDLLHSMSRKQGEEDLSRFRDAFRDRYEDRMVPLAEALDEEVGVGFGPPPALSAEGAPLLQGVAGRGRPGNPSFTARDSVLLRLLTETVRDGRHELVLTSDDVAALKSDETSPVPDAVSATFQLARHGDDDVRVVVTAVTGPSGARLLGRFCHADAGVEALVRDHVQAEERLHPEAAFAEIVHLPEGRVGNVLARPVLRPYEIEFLGASGADHDRVLPLHDLLVAVVGDRIVLRSQRLDREVVPRLSNAHNTVTGALAPYRFLAALQFQDVASTLMWSWGALDNATFTPRVVFGKTVLAKARWQAGPDQTKALREAKTLAAKFTAAQKLRESLRLPRHAVVAEADHELPIDLDRVGGIELLAHEASKYGSLRIIEAYPGRDELYAEREDGAYTHEIVLPLVRSTPTVTTRPVPPPLPEQAFVPGSEWLTVKLYCGPATADTVLREAVAPFVREVVGDAADGWFFIRYGDPDTHLRLRFTGDPLRLSGEVLPRFRETVEPLLRDGVVKRVLLDTYRREVARYGGPEHIARAERFFHADSDAVLAILSVAGGDEGLDLRWRLAVAGVDKILSALPVADRREAVRRFRDGYVAEQGATGEAAKRRSGKLFRDERNALSALLDGTPDNPALAAGLAALDARAPYLEGLPVETLNSHVHMHVNRMLRAAQRTQELVVLDLLDRLYAARLGRAKSGS